MDRVLRAAEEAISHLNAQGGSLSLFKFVSIDPLLPMLFDAVIPVIVKSIAILDQTEKLDALERTALPGCHRCIVITSRHVEIIRCGEQSYGGTTILTI